MTLTPERLAELKTLLGRLAEKDAEIERLTASHEHVDRLLAASGHPEDRIRFARLHIEPTLKGISRPLALAITERDVARAEIDRLQELAIDQHGEPYRDRFRNQMDAAAELLAEVARLRAAVAAVEALADEWDAYDAEGYAAGDGPPALARVEEIRALLAEAVA